jgi:ABC-2 type transport system ATP-binding protein
MGAPGRRRPREGTSGTTTGRRATAIILAVALGASLTLAACSSDGSDGDATPAKDRGRGGHACDQGATLDQVKTSPVDGLPHDLTVTSFDGTRLRAHWFPVDGAKKAEPAPTVLMGPGWSLAGDTSLDGAALFGALSIKSLHAAGYNVLTWDPRGFGASKGTVTVNDPAHEGRDVQVLLDWTAEQPEALTDDDGDPRVGMVGWSYGGGIQLVAAAVDCRIDAIVPGIAWNSLGTSLYKADTVKAGWSDVLYDSASKADLDPHITSAHKAVDTGVLRDDDARWFRSRGPGMLVDDIDIPTLFVQGTVDTLFTLDEAITNQESLLRRKVPTAMVWFCGGHGTCLTDPGDPDRVGKASLAWLDRYVKEDEGVDTGPAFDMVDQDGTRWTGDAYPARATSRVRSRGSGVLTLDDEGGSGPIQTPEYATDLLSGLVSGITPAIAEHTVKLLAGEVTAPALAVGAPKVTLTYSGEPGSGAAPTRVFAQLVDEERDVVVGNQITPIALELDGKTHTTTVDLEVIAQYLRPNAPLVLQIVATTVAYATPRLGGVVTFGSIEVSIPITDRLKKVAEK